MKKREPFIGITCDIQHYKRMKPPYYELVCDYRYPQAVKQAGGYPILLPMAFGEKIIHRYLDQMDGIIIVGGDDVDPKLYGEKKKRGTGTVPKPRIKFECKLYEEAKRRKLPVMGICYGMQLINVLEGGSLFQDIRRDARSRLNHRNKKNPHIPVTIDPTSRLGKIIGKRRIIAHCEHHQAVSTVAPSFKPVAFASDNIIEAIESRSKKILAIQWHPERLFRAPSTRRLFRAFVMMCRKKTKKAKRRRRR
ncbi:MAG: gamma-glutamyl-gamma-aminobutyrate hydrolase family protein [Candidatus Omnitrophica bacterium]|nr:gamma-glutamyl-gamma-aminobutyrate hydrolase family protein [Candidatus Omnitrophota bacterium]